MKDLTALLEGAGLGAVRTYIQSGNVVFQKSQGTSISLAKRIGDLVLKSRGFLPKVFVLSSRELSSAVEANPFPQAEADPKAVHLYFLSKPSAPDLESLSRLRTGREAFEL